MIISLVGYMGSGKSHIAKLLREKTGFELIDLDKEISIRNKMTIAEIFTKKGEIFFRKEERAVLEEILASKQSCILSLGGGTPAYYNNMEVINGRSISFYLRAKVPTLVSRITKQKAKRPIVANISDDDLPEFIAKHLFERNPFYNAAQYIIDTDGKMPDEICEEIIAKIPI